MGMYVYWSDCEWRERPFWFLGRLTGGLVADSRSGMDNDAAVFGT